MSGRVTRTGVVLLTAGLVAAVAALPASALGTARPATPHEKHHEHGLEVASRHLTLGQVLTNTRGRVMYIFAKDKPRVSHCGAGCVAAWPRVTSAAKPLAEDGVHGAHLGRIAKNQVTYYGHPLYYFTGDTRPRQASGQNVGSFFVVTTAGKVVKPKAPTSAARTVVSSHVAGTNTVIATSAGHTLYELSSERDGSTPSFYCQAGCTSVWVPLLTTGAPKAAGKAMASELGTVKRPGGSTQVTYDHHPLYTYIGDDSPGQHAGEDEPGSEGYWYDIDPDGSPII